MKKLLSTLLVVVLLFTSLGLTAFAEDDYTVQYLNDGFIRINLVNQTFQEGTARTFTVNIAEDGDYAMFVGNPNQVSTRFTVTFTKGGQTVSAVYRVRTGTYPYSRLGVQPEGGVVSSFALTKGEWTVSVDATDSTIPYIDIRPTTIMLDGTKQAIYPMDVNSADSAPYFHEYINTSGGRYATAPSDYAYYGNLEDSALAVPKTAHGAVRVTNGKTATFKVNAETAGEYKITAYGNFRTNSANVNKEADEVETINMTVGSNPAAVGSYTYAKGYYGWGDFVSFYTTVNLPVGVTNIVFSNPNTDSIKADWYLDYVLVEGINLEDPEDPEAPEDPEIPEVPADPEKPNDFPLNRTSSYLTIGMTAQLTTDETVTWATSDKTVATVSADGLVTAVALGEAYITAATSDGKTSLCKVTVYDNNVRNHETVPTPDINGGSFLTDLFGKENFKVMLTFDDNAEDITGNVNTTVFDTLTYDKGFNGKAANFTNGYVELTDAKLGKGSITISTWLKPGDVSDGFDTIISTTPYNTGTYNYTGFYSVIHSTGIDIFYTIKDVTYRKTMNIRKGTEAPSDLHDGWVNLTYVFDRENSYFYIYVDYELVYSWGMHASANWDGEWAPMLGRGKTGNGSVLKYDGLMDDFFIYSGAMSAADLQQIKGYYKVGEAVPVEDISLDTKELLLAINETSTIPTTIAPADATIQNLVWTSSDSSVATVDARGKVRGIGKGTATITATTVDGGFKDTCTVTVSDSIAPFEYDRVCIIGIDGAGAWLDDDFMPNVRRIFSPYATTNVNQTTLPSVSATNWGSILHGVGYEYHRLNNYTGGYFTYPIDSPYPSIFRILHEAEPDAQMASFASYGTINRGLIENGLGVLKVGGTDDEVHPQVLDYISENDPRLMFAYYGDVDHAGHTYGYGPNIPKYVEAMSKCDGFIADIYEAYEEKGYLDTTLFILCTDHGGTGTYHGGDTPTEMNTFLGLAGPGVRQNSVMGESYTYDVAAIVAHALGIEKPAGWTAKVPDGAFVGVVGDTRNEVPLPGTGYRDHINTQTPKEEGTHLTDIFGEENFAALLEFDGNATDTLGKNETTVNNTLTYEEGYFGKGADFSQGSVTLAGTQLGQNSFTIGMWMKTDSLTGSPLLMASKEYDALAGDGFYAVLDNSITDNTVMKLQFREGNKTVNLGDNYLYKDYKDGWTHILFVFDRERGYITSYVDFRITNGDVLSTDMLVASNPLTIGSDIDGNHAYPLTATLDDVFVYNGAMTEADIAKLATYYQKEGAKINITDVQFGDTVSFDYTVDGDPTGSIIYAAVYDNAMKLIDVKKIPVQLGGGYGIQNASAAKHLKVFVVDNNLVPKCVPATASKN